MSRRLLLPFAGMTHRDLQDALDRMEIPVGAAEAHGWLCGALCARGGYGARDWIRDLAEDAGAALDREASREIREVHEDTLASLGSPDFAFAPVLPDEETPLAERVTALAAWCGGFLYGIGRGASSSEALETGDVGEYLDDLSNISRAELEAGRGAESGESDFMELFEFVRAGTQLAWLELAEARSHAAR